MSTSCTSRAFLLVALLGAATGAQAQEISRWIDENGQVHFGNPQFAPQDRSERVDVAPTNGMQAVDTDLLYQRRAPRAGRMVYVPHNTSNKHVKGWRGHEQAAFQNRAQFNRR